MPFWLSDTEKKEVYHTGLSRTPGHPALATMVTSKSSAEVVIVVSAIKQTAYPCVKSFIYSSLTLSSNVKLFKMPNKMFSIGLKGSIDSPKILDNLIAMKLPVMIK